MRMTMLVLMMVALAGCDVRVRSAEEQARVDAAWDRAADVGAMPKRSTLAVRTSQRTGVAP